MEPQSAGSPPASPGEPPPEELLKPSAEMMLSEEPPEEEEEAAVKPDRRSSSSSTSSSRAPSVECVFHVEAAEMSAPLVAAAAAPDVDDHATTACGPEAKPGDWASWPEDPPPAVDDPVRSDGGTILTGMTQPPEAQTMAMPAAAPADTGFNPDRIPESIFQAKTSSQAEWSIASNESLFSIQGAGPSDDLGGLYSGSRSHFDYFYDEAMAAAGGGDPDWKLPTLAEGSELAVPGSAASDESAGAKNAMAFRRHESGSAGSSSNFSFAFPILAETSPRKRDSAGGYYQLRKEYDQPAPPSGPALAFEEMTTEEERKRRTGWCWCGQCCGCCWFACSWPSCSCCCWFACSWPSCSQWRWRCCSRCSCSCSCPSCCRCSWCL